MKETSPRRRDTDEPFTYHYQPDTSMSRLTDNDRTYGPFTIARWKDRFEFTFSSGGGHTEPRNHFMFIAFGWALRIYVPTLIKPYGERYDTHEREYGIILVKDGDECGYDFLMVHYGPQTHDSLTTKAWSKFIPWKQWNHVRNCIYTPNGTLFATEEKGKWNEFYKLKEECPKVHFGIEDYDGDMRIASCIIEEREWHKGTGWFKWLKYFSKPKIHRSIWFEFDYEVGPGKNEWKGGTCATGMEMLPGEDPESAFRRWCEKEHHSKYRNYKVRFIGKSKPPEAAEIRVARNRGWEQDPKNKDAWSHKDYPPKKGFPLTTSEMLALIKAERDENNAKMSAQVASK